MSELPKYNPESKEVPNPSPGRHFVKGRDVYIGLEGEPPAHWKIVAPSNLHFAQMIGGSVGIHDSEGSHGVVLSIGSSSASFRYDQENGTFLTEGVTGIPGSDFWNIYSLTFLPAKKEVIITKKPEGIKATRPAVPEAKGVVESTKEAVKDLKQAIKLTATDTKEATEGAMEATKEATEGAMEATKEAAEGAMEATKGAAEGTMELAKGIAKGTMEVIMGTADETAKKK